VRYNHVSERVDEWPARCAVSFEVEKNHTPLKGISVQCEAKDHGECVCVCVCVCE
jgi:hypothetical protein